MSRLPIRPAGIGIRIALVLCALAPSAVSSAQTATQFPSPGAPASPPSYPGGAMVPRTNVPSYGSAPYGGVSPYGAPPSVAPGMVAPPPQYLPPAETGSPSIAYPPGQTPAYAPGAIGGQPGQLPPPVSPYESATVPPPGFDPYATPGAQGSTWLPRVPDFFGTTQPGTASAPPTVAPWPSQTWETIQRFRKVVAFDWTWVAGSGNDEFGMHDFLLYGSFNIPTCIASQPSLVVTPGVALHLWSGLPEQPFDMPPRAYDAFLDAAWNPVLSEQISGELSFRVGVYSDFNELTSQSLRYTGRGVAHLALPAWPNMTFKAGVIYYDRERIKLLPVVGVYWVPNSDVVLDITFPEPKASFRFDTVAETEWWVYVRGEYGGGSWTIKQPQLGDNVIPTDYNDLRFAAGLEFKDPVRLDGLFEVGLAFEREIYARDRVWHRPNPGVFLRGALYY